MGKPRLQPYDKLSHTQEILLGSVPTAYRVNIWIICLVILLAILWATFGEMEEVVRTTGRIRPQLNISTVANIVPGKITGIFFYPGQEVKEGSLLLEVDSQALNTQLKALNAQEMRYQERIKGLYHVQQSFAVKKNVVPENLIEARSRFASFLSQTEILEVNLSENAISWEEEKKLLPNATTINAVREVENKMKRAQLDFQKYQSDFILEIKREEEGLLLELAKVQSQIYETEQSLLQCQIRAPLDGLVQIQSSLNAGDFLRSGQEILKIVPQKEDRLKIELYVPSTLAGKILEGSKVAIRFPSLPFHEFGGVTGTIEKVSPDINVDEKGQGIFTIYSSINEDILRDRQGREYPLKVGLQVDGRIILKKQSIFYSLLEKLDFVL